ncbi:MAG TPA: hypothetical protein VNT01_11215 [Symbiobacteriaceae bacterium]|nr:hypothetical protein [Symbiobacteriaceae bacterium]
MRREQVHMMLDVLLDMGQRLVARPMPPEVKQHFTAARRETLLGIRAVVDAAIERMDEEPAATAAGPASIKIEEE